VGTGGSAPEELEKGATPRALLSGASKVETLCLRGWIGCR
jgi:hypothetical protein